MEDSLYKRKWGLRAIETVMLNYLLFLIAFQPFEEYYNCLHPSPNSELIHFVCDWDKDDFVKLDDTIFLKKTKEDDNPIKKRARQKYWEKRK